MVARDNVGVAVSGPLPPGAGEALAVLAVGVAVLAARAVNVFCCSGMTTGRVVEIYRTAHRQGEKYNAGIF